MTTLLRPLAAVAVIVTALAACAAIFGPNNLVKPLSALIILVALLDCAVLGYMWRVWVHHKDLAVLRDDLMAQAMTTVGAIFLGAVGVNELDLPHRLYPQGVGTVLLLLSLLVISIAPLLRLITYYRAGR